MSVFNFSQCNLSTPNAISAPTLVYRKTRIAHHLIEEPKLGILIGLIGQIVRRAIGVVAIPVNRNFHAPRRRLPQESCSNEARNLQLNRLMLNRTFMPLNSLNAYTRNATIGFPNRNWILTVSNTAVFRCFVTIQPRYGFPCKSGVFSTLIQFYQTGY